MNYADKNEQELTSEQVNTSEHNSYQVVNEQNERFNTTMHTYENLYQPVDNSYVAHFSRSDTCQNELNVFGPSERGINNKVKCTFIATDHILDKEKQNPFDKSLDLNKPHLHDLKTVKQFSRQNTVMDLENVDQFKLLDSTNNANLIENNSMIITEEEEEEEEAAAAISLTNNFINDYSGQISKCDKRKDCLNSGENVHQKKTKKIKNKQSKDNELHTNVDKGVGECRRSGRKRSSTRVTTEDSTETNSDEDDLIIDMKFEELDSYVPEDGNAVKKVCKCQCFNSVGIDRVEKIYKLFCGINDYNEQNNYLQEIISSSYSFETNTKKNKKQTTEHIQNYIIEYENIKHNICEATFQNIFGLKTRRFVSIKNKCKKTEPFIDNNPKRPKKTKLVSVPEKEKEPKNIFSDEQKKLIQNHLTCFPLLKSKFSSIKEPLKMFLTPGLNDTILYNLYQSWVKEKELIISSSTYKDILAETNYNIEPLYSDQCHICEKRKKENVLNNHYESTQGIDNEFEKSKIKIEKNKSPELSKKKNEFKFEEHNNEVKYISELMNSYKCNNDPNVAAICVDFKQPFALPKLSPGAHNYKRKFWIYNFIVHNLKTGRVVAYLWNESVAKRGANEIANCLLQYILKYITLEKKLILFSTNNKSRYKHIDMVLALLQKIHEKRFDSIEHIFLVPGHNITPCQVDYSNINRKIRPVEICSQESYGKLIMNCRNPRRYDVHHMSRSRFHNLSILQNMIDSKHLNGPIFREGKIFTYTNTYKQGFGIKTSYQQTEPYFIQIQRNMYGNYDPNTFDLTQIHLPDKYPGPLRLSEGKLKDLKSCLSLTPPHQSSFLSNIIFEQDSIINNFYCPEDYASDEDILDYCN